MNHSILSTLRLSAAFVIAAVSITSAQAQSTEYTVDQTLLYPGNLSATSTVPDAENSPGTGVYAGNANSTGAVASDSQDEIYESYQDNGNANSGTVTSNRNATWLFADGYAAADSAPTIGQDTGYENGTLNNSSG